MLWDCFDVTYVTPKRNMQQNLPALCHGTPYTPDAHVHTHERSQLHTHKQTQAHHGPAPEEVGAEGFDVVDEGAHVPDEPALEPGLDFPVWVTTSIVV